MGLINQYSRISHHTSTDPVGAFTVPLSEDFTDGSWDVFDLALSEFGVLEDTEQLFIRIGGTIKEVNLTTGGNETLAETLVLGNATGGTDISISTGDVIVFEATATQIAMTGTTMDLTSATISLNGGTNTVLRTDADITFDYNGDSYTFPVGDGTIGQVLETDGAGQISWGDATVTMYEPGSAGTESIKTVGGGTNDATGNYATVSGGINNLASGLDSFVGGGTTNTATVQHSAVVGGSNNEATGNNSFVGGGTTNKASGIQATIVGGGNLGHTANGTRSFIGGGADNVASAQDSTVTGGNGNTASGNNSIVNGGSANTASSLNSSVGGGAVNTASATASHVTGGIYAIASRYGERSHAAGGFSATPGTAQHIELISRNTTNNTTPTIMYIDGAASLITVASGTSLSAIINISGIEDDGTEAAHYVRKVMIKNVGGTTSLVGAVQTIGTDVETSAGLDVTITADNTNDALDIKVTGLASTNMKWVAHTSAVEIIY